jgi:hypothetical protein
MEFTKDNFLDTDKFKNILEGKETKKQNKLISLIKNHKIISGVIIFSSACMIINAIMVFSFFSMLKSFI